MWSRKRSYFENFLKSEDSIADVNMSVTPAGLMQWYLPQKQNGYYKQKIELQPQIVPGVKLSRPTVKMPLNPRSLRRVQ